MFLHKNGWLEIKDIKMDSISVLARTTDKIENYRNTYLPKIKPSLTRIQYLIKTISYLKDYGNVYLVRLPIDERMFEIEKDFMSDFDLKIREAINLSNGYLDMTPRNRFYEYTDGNHLHKDSGKKVSYIVAKWIADKE
jgi:hypothetical protein